jgi:ribonuclease E
MAFSVPSSVSITPVTAQAEQPINVAPVAVVVAEPVLASLQQVVTAPVVGEPVVAVSHDAAPVVEAPAAAPVVATTAPVAMPAPAPVVDKATLHAIVQAAGLTWVESNPDRVAQALASLQTTVAPTLGRAPKPAVIVSSAPLQQVETRRD